MMPALRRQLILAVLALVLGGCGSGTTKPAPLLILIQPLGKVSNADILAVKTSIGATIRAKVTVLEAKALPASAFYKPRSRYRAEKILAYLSSIAPKGATMIAVTAKDISTDKDEHVDWGIFGFGKMPGTVCVVSSYRLGKAGIARTSQRLAKVALHELGHTLGLEHCPSPKCLMADGEGGVKKVDEGEDFCAKCRSKIAKDLR